MSSQQNRFALLSPDFAAEDARRKKAAATVEAKKQADKKKEEEEREKAKEKERAERQAESGMPTGAPGPRRGFRGARGGPRGGRPYRGRGERGRGERSRGGYSGGAPAGPAGTEEVGPREAGDHRFPGSGDPLHPYDRKSGTGRGYEISKRGGGPRNWGRPEDALKHEDLIDKAVEEEGFGEEGADVEGGYEGRAERRQYYKKRQEPKSTEEELTPYGTAVSYKEYQAIMAEKRSAAPSTEAAPKPEGESKAPETQDKESGTPCSRFVGDYQPHEGRRGRRGGRRGGRFGGDDNRGPRRDFEERGDNWGGDSRPKDRSYPPRADAHAEQPKEEPKKPEPKPFVMKDEDFPELK
jgi:plasminogen activator inhibitor 1 RNA-binding protein